MFPDGISPKGACMFSLTIDRPRKEILCPNITFDLGARHGKFSFPHYKSLETTLHLWVSTCPHLQKIVCTEKFLRHQLGYHFVISDIRKLFSRH